MTFATNKDKPLILMQISSKKTDYNDRNKKRTTLENFVDKRRLNKNLSLVVSSNAEIYAIHIKQANLKH